MASNKKPRKKYVQKHFRGANMPTPQNVITQWETLAWNAVMSLRQHRYDRAIGLDLILALTIRGVTPDDSTEVLGMLLAAFKAINNIKDRHDRTGVWGSSGDDLRAIEENVPPLLGLMPQMNRAEFYASMLKPMARLDNALTRNEEKTEEILTNS